MLAQLEKPHHDFLALSHYLVHGKTRPTHPDRVAWVIEQNLGTDDPMRAAKLMTATAELSKRCRTACYHAIIAWREDEQPTPEIMQEIARRTLGLAGLAEHQALVMGHGDKTHPHLHMMINRVHPVTGRAWSTSHDYRRFDHIMKQLSEEYGFHYAPGHAFEPELTDELPKQPGSAATYAARRGANTHRPQWSRAAARRYGKRLSDDLDRATSWEDVEALLAEDGFRLEAKGSGLIVGDENSYAKLSALGLKISAKGLTRRFSAQPSQQERRPARPSVKPRATTRRRSVFALDAVDIARAIGDRDDVRSAVQDAIAERKARLARKPIMQQLLAEMREQWKAGTMLAPPKRKRPPPRHRRTRARSPGKEHGR